MIGTILMVAVVVLLAATVGTFVLGVADDAAQTEPLTTFRMSQDGATVVLTHTGGDTLDGENVYVVSESDGWLGNYAGTNGQACETTTSTVKAGTECSISGVSSGDIAVVWRSDARSAVLFRAMVFESTRAPAPTTTPTSTPPGSGGGGVDCTQTSVTITSDINGDVVVSGNVDVSSGATINGDIRAGGTVDLRDPSDTVTVNGDVTSGGPAVQASATVTGTVDDNRGGSYSPCST
jgi:FlaG/FlaF family flagellin (archaellin)